MAAMWRNVVDIGFKNMKNLTALCRPLPVRHAVIRYRGGYSRWVKRYLRDLWRRRIEAGPEPERHRSEWSNWSYDAEIFAFGKRLGENFNESTLRTAFTHRSYIEKEEKNRADLGVTSELELEDNSKLVHSGKKITSDYIKAYLRFSLPYLPEDGICAVHDHLVSDDLLAHVGSNLGVKDLILCAEFPPETETLSETLIAVIGALAQNQGVERAQLFVQDFLLTQLVGKDLLNMWDITNPMGLLAGILARQNRGEPEPRLLWETGSETVLSAYLVGIYSDKTLIGKGPGETVTIAEEMAARDALRRMFRITENRAPFKFGKDGRSLEISTFKPNPSVAEYV